MSKLQPSRMRMPRYERESWRRIVIASESERYLSSQAIPVAGAREIPEVLEFVRGEIAEVISNSAHRPVQQSDIDEQRLKARHVHIFVAEIWPDLAEAF